MLDLLLTILPVVVHLLIGSLEGNEAAETKKIVTAPPQKKGFPCGYKHTLGWHHLKVEGVKVPFYDFNTTVKKLESEGFEITVNGMIDDAISNFTYTNGTTKGEMVAEGYGGNAPVGGRPALRTRGNYMAQLGIKRGDDITWVCDGVLINKLWVLSAAHCFVNDHASPNIIRLGDYDVSVPPEQNKKLTGKFIENYYIYDVVFHPEYTGDEWYHDLVLIPLERPIPQKSHSINPICLPWGTPPDIEGKTMTLTGWGATVFKGPKTPLLQEVDLVKFDISVCNEGYSSLDNFKGRYPNGLKSEETLCVGWPEGGKDACGGDSGAPLVLDREDDILLIGIVSSGHGCGKKGFPGLYIPMTEPKYLQWVKDVAFKDYV